MKKKYKVKILDEPHTIVSDKPESEVMEIAAYVDDHIKQILKSMKNPKIEKAAMLAALNVTEELFELKNGAASEQAGFADTIQELLGNVEQALEG